MFAVLPHVTLLSTLLLGSALVPAASAQLSFQSHQVAQYSGSSDIAGHGDFNNDGREDLLVAENATTPSGFAHSNLLYLSNGDGTYDAPRTLSAEFGAGLTAVGDFNHDGKLDFASQESVLNIYLGNGDGTFQPAKPVSGSTGANWMVAADMNHDGRTDLIQLLQQNAGGQSLQIWISNGDGTFAAGQHIASLMGTNLAVGDFDGDGKTDVAVLFSEKGATTVQVWYGDGAGHVGSPFSITDPSGYEEFFGIAPTGDLNNDGRSDIVGSRFHYGSSGTSQFFPQLGAYVGNANRTLTFQAIATNGCPAAGIAIADFNGNGLNDLAFDEGSCSGGGAQTFVVKPGTGSGAFGSDQIVYQHSFPANFASGSALRSTRGTRPDLIFSQQNAALSQTGSTPTALVLLTNQSTGSFPPCAAPNTAEGVSICSPGATAGSPASFSIATAGPTPMRGAEVWADGKKVALQLAHSFSNYSFLNASVPLAAGSHSIAVYGFGVDDTLQQRKFTLLVAGASSCAAPSTAGIHICSPVNGSSVSSPVNVSAAGTVTGTFARFEVWVDGVKKFTSTTTDGANFSLAEASGSHRFAFYAVNTAGTKWSSSSTITVH